ncbi:hypothetical protein [Hoeflea sp.]|uniref:hypothetical protein n=1 Tax=Hoeflea sp. TaxID=1940281 RepID=UPI0019919A4B|nr:hypothetical protein [Hoeflea sp.]MBC7279883.1 hypothetical protein [Hoeflea sp.]
MTAEGAETRGQIEALREAGCQLIQGYHFGRPVPLADVSLAILRGVAAAARLHMDRSPPRARPEKAPPDGLTSWRRRARCRPHRCRSRRTPSLCIAQHPWMIVRCASIAEKAQPIRPLPRSSAE